MQMVIEWKIAGDIDLNISANLLRRVIKDV